jgi:hypothetical protein
MNHQVVHQRHAASASIIPSPPSGGAPVSGNSESSKTHPRAGQHRLLSRRIKTSSQKMFQLKTTSQKVRAVVAIAAATAAVLGLVVLLSKVVGMISSSSTTNYMFHHPTKLAFPKTVSDMLDEKHHMPFNAIYRSPDSMTIVGDRSDRYAKLRQEIDPLLPVNPQRSLERVQQLTSHQYTPMDMAALAASHDHNSDQVHQPGDSAMAAYDIYNCPDTPPSGYPFEWNMLQVLQNWPPDDPKPRPHIFQSLCVFDYQRDYDKAMQYRQAEVPFVVVNDPAVHRTVERWNEPGYMEAMLGNEPHRCEYS